MTGEPGNAAALGQVRFFVSSVTLFPMGRGERARGVWETISAPAALTRRDCILCEASNLISRSTKQKKPVLLDELFSLAAGEGFEPSHTESESAVLPLHNPAIFTEKKPRNLT